MKKQKTRLPLEKFQIARLTKNMNKVMGGSIPPQSDSSLECSKDNDD